MSGKQRKGAASAETPSVQHDNVTFVDFRANRAIKERPWLSALRDFLRRTKPHSQLIQQADQVIDDVSHFLKEGVVSETDKD
jgi:hypothetical protein